jgi:Rieske Fe-S protein
VTTSPLRVFEGPTLSSHAQRATGSARGQACTHLSCAVVPRIEEGVIHCPCHEGYFDLFTGRNIAGPPPRPLPRIELDVRGDVVFAVGIVERTV